ncbi:MAG: PTS sugar transporter subunit IIA [Deltaproteobacteria bacterium]
MGTVNLDVKISTLLKKKYIKLDLNTSSKKEIICELVDLLAESNKLTDKKAFLSLILKREKLGSTGIGNGLAIPHAKSDAVDGFAIAFGRHSQGVDFGALDGEKTFLFFMLASPSDNVGGHLKILADISHFVKDKFIIECLKKAKDEAEVLEIIARYEKK